MGHNGASPMAGLPAGSPVKESSFLKSETTADELQEQDKVGSGGAGAKKEIPIRT